jgi:hypothetical protein
MGGAVERGWSEPHSVRPTLERRVVARCATRSHQLRSLLRTQKRAHRVRPPRGGVRCWRSNSVHAIPALMPALSCEDHDTRELSLYRASYSGLHNGCHPKRSAALRLRSGQALRNAVEGSMLIQRRWYREVLRLRFAPLRMTGRTQQDAAILRTALIGNVRTCSRGLQRRS